MSGVGINPLHVLPSPNCPRTTVEGETTFPTDIQHGSALTDSLMSNALLDLNITVFQW